MMLRTLRYTSYIHDYLGQRLKIMVLIADGLRLLFCSLRQDMCASHENTGSAEGSEGLL